MSKTDYAGIDYGLGQSNKDTVTGICYGVIPLHSLAYPDDWFEPVYPDVPRCHKCGNDGCEATSKDTIFACFSCMELFDTDDCCDTEPDGWECTDSNYTAHWAFDNTVAFITRSPFYTFAQYCSPCAPGAGNLDSPCDTGAKTYCFGHDCFESGVAPYDVYSVESDEKVLPTK